MKKNIVIFGATGSLGAYLSTFLCQYFNVYAVGHRSNDNGFFGQYNIPYFSVDITQQAQFARLPQDNIYAVLHFAGDLPASMKGYNAVNYIQSVVLGTFHVLEYARLVKADRLIFPQTLFDISYLFGQREPIPADAKRIAPMEGDHSMYVIAKNMAVDMIEHYYHNYGLKRFIFRLSRIYLYHPNPYTFTDGKKVMVSDRFLIYQAMKGRDIEIWGDPNRVLETISITDFEQIILCALQSEHDGGFYNIGSGGSTLDERVKGIIDVFSPKERPSKIIYCPEKKSAQQFLLDYSKTSRELGYQPRQKWHDYLVEFKHEMEIQRFAKLWGNEKDFFDYDNF